MALLTLANIPREDYQFYTSWQVLQRGRILYNQGQVTIAEFRGDTAICLVLDAKTVYTVTIRAISPTRTESTCTCPRAERPHVCEHIVASVIAMRHYIKEVAEKRWDYRLSKLLHDLPQQRRSPSPPSPYILIYYLYWNAPLANFYLLPHMVPLDRWPEAPQEPLDTESFNQYLDANRSWQNVIKPARNPDPSLCRNLPPEAVQTCNIILDAQSRHYYRHIDSRVPDSIFGPYLPLLAQQNVPIFLREKRIHWHKQPLHLEASLVRDGRELLLDIGLMTEDSTCSAIRGNLLIISTDHPWVLAGNTLAPIANPELLAIIPHLPLSIPVEEELKFRENYLRILAERIPLKSDIATIHEIYEEPVPRLYLREEGGTLQATMVFGYGDYEVEANPKASPVAAVEIPGSWDIARIHRRLDREYHFYQLLTNARYGLKRGGRIYGPAVFLLRARTHPLDFIVDCIPRLAEAGFEIYGEENIRSARLSRATPALRVDVSSGIDWFDIQAVVEYGDQIISLKEIRQALRRGKRFVKLADGSFGQIPQEWLERYKHLFGLAEETDKGFRVRDIHLPLLDELLETADMVQAPADLAERRERLRSFEHLTPQPVPDGFQGELRPYQKAGLDWLHFLHDYDMGGILADDMGLGKTIQVLAFLQSLKEQGKAERASLLVVPRSLLVNWQREAARFTPQLSVMVFAGAGRKKDTALFDQHDIVLTTYGIVLRDIEFLRSYRFHYAILDESQAIKNPRAKTARAARILNADHRLAMTGTPLENTTFELWSQFAFALPGLLGGVEYFRREFAIPIERHSDQAAAASLRKLIYPFIMRRTKAQVAPELPPRTERTIFTDLTPAQRRLYHTVRDRYRAELLGLIDEEGMDNARFKVLEGLLRLRQICLHPALVRPTYRGKAAKFEVLFETLETLLAEQHKVLIYSQFVQVLGLVRAELDRRQIPYAYLDGRTRHRQKQVDRFQNDPEVPFFLLSLKAGGVGLNLTAADYVIMLDPWWNPAVEIQAADRVHRIGQDKPVFVYKLIARETVEEKILQLQARKRDLVENLITTETSFAKTLTRDDVEVLFS